MRQRSKIAFAASEVAPFAKTGGLGDVGAALPVELHNRGDDVRLFLPFYSTIETKGHAIWPVEFIRNVPIRMGRRTYTVSASTTTVPGSDLPLYLIDCPELYHRGSIYTSDPDEPVRFALFSRAVIECCQRMGWAPDVFHCNDWHTALLPLFLRTVYGWDRLFAGSRTLLTVHNVGYQGLFPAHEIGEVGLGEWIDWLDPRDTAHGRFNFLRTGLIYADAVSTVSPTHAEEIQTSEYGMGLEELLRARRNRLIGILNGVDYREWNPATDRYIPYRFSAADLEGKEQNKRHLLQSLALAPSSRAPLVGVVSRLTPQKGFDLCLDVLPRFLSEHDARLVVLGSGEARYEGFFAGLQRYLPDRVSFRRGYDEKLAHTIEAGSDMLLMPSRYEPCGLNQMFSLRYGTVPIVRRTGGLADSVRPFDGERGTGIVFDHYLPTGLDWALHYALQVFGQRDRWRQLVSNGMHQDFSWQRQAEHYRRLYRMLAP